MFTTNEEFQKQQLGRYKWELENEYLDSEASDHIQQEIIKIEKELRK